MNMHLQQFLESTCAQVGIKPPRITAWGRWIHTDTLGKNGKNDGRVMIFSDGRGGVCYNWQTGIKETFRIERAQSEFQSPKSIASDQKALRDARALDLMRRQERGEIAKICADILGACKAATHPYLIKKGFPDEFGLTTKDIGFYVPKTPIGARIAAALPPENQSLLIIPASIDNKVATLQFINGEGVKKNMYGGQIGGAYHRLCRGRETWVCEGIATALSIRAALRLLSRSASVLCAFSAGNVAKVAAAIPKSIIAADHDKPIDAFGGMGTGEYYARKSGCPWIMPPEPGDFNDLHQSQGLRSLAMLIRGGVW